MAKYVDTAGENLVAGNLCYRKSDGKLWKAKADVTTTMPAVALASTTIAADDSGEFHSRGIVSMAAHGFGASGVLLYTSAATAGLITATAPVTSGHQVQVVGQIIDANSIDFYPNFILIEIA